MPEIPQDPDWFERQKKSGTTPAPGSDFQDVGSWLEDKKRREIFRVNLNLEQSQKLNPDVAARTVRLQGRTGLSMDILQDFTPEQFEKLEQESSRPDFDATKFRYTNPITFDYIGKHKWYATLAKPDLLSLTQIEQLLNREPALWPKPDSFLVADAKAFGKKHAPERIEQIRAEWDANPPIGLETWIEPSLEKIEKELEEDRLRLLRDEEAQIAASGPVGFSETFSLKAPFVKDIISLADSVNLYNAAQRWEAGQASEVDEDMLVRFARLQRAKELRGESMWGTVGSILSDLPAEMTEFIATGGAYSGVKNLVLRGGKEVVEGLLKRATRGVLARLAGVAAQTAIKDPIAVAADVYRRMTPDVGISNELKPILTAKDDNVLEAVARSLGVHFIENLSERTGAGAQKIAGKVGDFAVAAIPSERVKLGLRRALMSRWLRAHPTEGVTGFVTKLKTAAGWHGIVGEMFEERVAGVGRDIVEGERISAAVAGQVPEIFGGRLTSQQLMAEAIAFSIPGAGMMAAQGLAGSRPRPQPETNTALLKALGDHVVKMELPKRSPQEAEAIVGKMVANTKYEKAYISPEVVGPYYKAKNIDPQEAITKITGDPKAYEQAVARGHDIAIPTEKYAVRVVPTEDRAFYEDEVRWLPNEQNAREQREDLTREKAAALKTKEEQKAEEEQAKLDEAAQAEVAAGIGGELKKLGFSREAESLSEVLARRAIVRARARGLGENPVELWKKHALEISRGEGAVAAAEDVEGTQRSEAIDELNRKIDLINRNIESALGTDPAHTEGLLDKEGKRLENQEQIDAKNEALRDAHITSINRLEEKRDLLMKELAALKKQGRAVAAPEGEQPIEEALEGGEEPASPGEILDLQNLFGAELLTEYLGGEGLAGPEQLTREEAALLADAPGLDESGGLISGRRGAIATAVRQAQLFGERAEGVPETYTRKSAEDAGVVRLLNSPVLAVHEPAETTTAALTPEGSATPVLYELEPSDESAKTFVDAISAAKQTNVFGAAVHVYPEADYKAMRLFVNEDGSAGFALKGDDIVSLFKNVNTPATGRVVDAIMLLAVKEGGRRLDAFDTILPVIYAPHGFTVVARTKWKDEFAPPGWDKQTFVEFNNGEPDVVYMAHDPAKMAREYGGAEEGAVVATPEEAVQRQTDALAGIQAPEAPGAPPTGAEAAPGAPAATGAPAAPRTDVAVEGQAIKIPPSALPKRFFQTATVRAGTETLERFGLKPGGRHTTREVARALERRQRALYGRIERDDRSDKAKEKIAKWIVTEVQFELDASRVGASAVGWYTTKFQNALDINGKAFPELVSEREFSREGAPAGLKILGNRKNARDFMTLMYAVTSDGARVPENSAMAHRAYKHFRENGELPKNVKWSDRSEALNRNFERVTRLLKTQSVAEATTSLLSEDTVRNLKKTAAEIGVDFSPQFAVDARLPLSAVVLGPKLGSFYANLMGSTGYLTMDRWWSRTFNRYRGTLLKKPTAALLASFKKLIRKPNISDREAIEASVRYRDSYEEKGFKNGTPAEVTGNNIYKDSHEKLLDAPFNLSDRTFMHATAVRAQEELAKQGQNLQIADIQATLWYYEKRLYGELGARSTDDISYEEAARQIVEGRADRPERPGVEELGGAVTGTPDGTFVEVEGEPAEPSEVGAEQVFQQPGITDQPPAPAFYHKIQLVLEEKMGNSATVEQVRGMIKDIKEEERKWSGIDEFLKGKEKVSKAELLEFLRANQLEIEEELKGTPEGLTQRKRTELQKKRAAINREIAELGYSTHRRLGTLSLEDTLNQVQVLESSMDGRVHESQGAPGAAEKVFVLFESAVNLDMALRPEAYEDEEEGTKFSQYQLPGGKNYRELLLTMPVESAVKINAVLTPGRSIKGDVSDAIDDVLTDMAMAGLEDREYGRNEADGIDITDFNDADFAKVKEIAKKYGMEVMDLTRTGVDPTFQSLHFVEENILAHVRFNERTDSDGKRVLFIEEIQSDWHQTGRKKGYGADVKAELDALKAEWEDMIVDVDDALRDMGKLGFDALVSARAAIRDNANYEDRWEIDEKYRPLLRRYYDNAQAQARAEERGAAVPDAPFKKTWHEFALKRMIRYAAENGFDKLAWTTGAQQVKRYPEALRQVVDLITWTAPDEAGDRHVQALKGEAVQFKGSLKADGTFSSGPAVGKDIAEVFGKGMADKIVSSKAPGRLEGKDFTVGGEGMKGFYDEMIPNFLTRFGKKYGAKVTSASITLRDPEDTSAPARKQHYGMESEIGKEGVVVYDENTKERFPFATREEGQAFISSRLAAELGQVEEVQALELTEGLKTAALQEGFSLFQPGAAGARGEISIALRKVILKLGKDADPTTVIHELIGHLGFEELMRDAFTPGTPQQLRDDLDALLEFVGLDVRAKDGEAVVRAAVKEEHHEMVARGAEAYIMGTIDEEGKLIPGKVPSANLRAAFYRIAQWLWRTYKQLRALNVELTPRVREVFDRLLATQEEIDAAHAEENMQPLFVDARAAGMSEDKAQKYIEALERANKTAFETLLDTTMAKVRREEKAWWKKEKEEAAVEIAAEVNQRQVYKALSAIKDGTTPDGKPLPKEYLPVGMDSLKLSKQAILDTFGDVLSTLPRGTYTVDGGMNPEIAAEILGYNSARELLNAISAAEPRLDLIERLAQEEMTNRYGAEPSDEELRNQAVDAVYNEDQAKVMRLELEHMLSEDFSAAKAGIRALTGKIPKNDLLRAQAEEAIAGMKIADIRPKVYQAAQAKASKQALEAFLAGDHLGAFRARSRALMNHELYLAAARAKELMAKSFRKWSVLSKPDDELAKTRDVNLINAARAILAQFGIGSTDKAPMEYLEEIRKYDEDQYEALRGLVADVAARTGALAEGGYTEFKFTEFITIKTAVDSLIDQSRRNRQIEIDGKLVDRDAAIESLKKRIDEIKTPGAKPGYERAVSTWDKVKMGLLGIKSALRRVESWVDAVDGGAPTGAARTYIWNPISEGVVKYREAKKIELKKYLASVKAVEKSLATEKIAAPEIKYTFSSKAELLGAMQHIGNESNLQKLLRGRKWGDFREDGSLDTSNWDSFIRRMWDQGIVTKEDHDFLQALWDQHEALKPEAQRAHKAMYGYYFDEITAKAILTPFGPYKGGYVPAIPDSFVVYDAALRQEREDLEKFDNSYMFPTTGRGFTKKRAEGYAKPLAMDLRFVPMHLDKVLRFIHIEPRVKDVARIVTNKEFRDSLDDLDPSVGGDMLVPWLQRAAQQKIETPMKGMGGRAASAFFRELRRRTGMQIMVANVTNTLQQLTGISLSALKVKPMYLQSALATYLSGPAELAKKVDEASIYMRNRQTARMIEIQKSIDDLLLNPSKYDQLRSFIDQHGYFMQQGTQNIVDYVTWSGAYDQATAEGQDQKQAVLTADSAVRQTQGSAGPEDVSRFETGTAFARMFTMFYSYFNMQANLLGTEYVKAMRDLGLKKGAGRLAYIYTMGFMIPAAISQAITVAMGGGPDDEDDDGYLDEWMAVFFVAHYRSAAGLLPGGSILTTAINKFNDNLYDDHITTSPAVNLIESAVSAPKSIYDALVEGGSRKRAVRDTLTLLGLISGLPLAPISRPIGYAIDVEEGKAQPESVLEHARGLITGKRGQK